MSCLLRPILPAAHLACLSDPPPGCPSRPDYSFAASLCVILWILKLKPKYDNKSCPILLYIGDGLPLWRSQSLAQPDSGPYLRGSRDQDWSAWLTRPGIAKGSRRYSRHRSEHAREVALTLIADHRRDLADWQRRFQQ